MSGNPEQLRILLADAAGEIARHAARELAAALATMTGEQVLVRASSRVVRTALAIADGASAPSQPSQSPVGPDSFGISRTPAGITIEGNSESALLHGCYCLLEQLGARFSALSGPCLPRIERARLALVSGCRVEPAFARRAIASDIMMWHYDLPQRLALHLEHDRKFIPWMAARGLNGFFFIRHAQDSRARIDELGVQLRGQAIAPEYGGHVLELLMPRDLFQTHPDYFAAADDGSRAPRGNLCVSNPDALAAIARGALAYVGEYRDGGILHVWGADLREGGWCRCGRCRELSPQLQYLAAVNAIAEQIGQEVAGLKIMYLAYHDTLEPDPAMRPLPNVWLEWAARERCYSHAIDDPRCGTNRRYFDGLRRYLGLFGGRAQVFEYYGDAILFGGLGFASPRVIARDLRAYRSLGIAGISCLTFGAYSAFAYPLNLEMFARAARSPDFEPEQAAADIAAERYGACAAEMRRAYEAIERASQAVLRYGDVMRPWKIAEAPGCAPPALGAATLEQFDEAARAAERVWQRARIPLAAAERQLWRFSRQTLEGIAEYIAARRGEPRQRRALGERAVGKIERALSLIRAVSVEIKGTWGAWDLERFHEIWLRRLRAELSENHLSARPSGS